MQSEGPKTARKVLIVQVTFNYARSEDGQGDFYELVLGRCISSADVGEGPAAQLNSGVVVAVLDYPADALNSSLHDDSVSAEGAVAGDVA